MAPPRKLKILLVGPVESKVEALKSKLITLQGSKAGPFHACFCVGNFGSNVIDMPLPVYVQDFKWSSSNGSNSNHQEKQQQEQEPPPKGIVSLASNLYWFKGKSDKETSEDEAVADIYAIPLASASNQSQSLVVAVCPPHAHVDTLQTKPFQDKVNHVSYVGCDIFLTSDWPQGIDTVMPPGSTSTAVAAAATSYDAAELAMRARPRYHVAPATTGGPYVQSMPFQHLQSSSSTTPIRHIGRFIALANVVPPAEAKQRGKAGKFIHALGITPLQDMSMDELCQTPPNTLQACPYTDETYEKDTNGGGVTSQNYGLSEAQARRIMAESSGTTGGDHRWKSQQQQQQRQHSTGNNHNHKRPRHNEDDATTPQVDPHCTTLFIHGLHKDASGALQTGSIALLQAFAKYNVQKVRRPPSTSSYAFLEFPSHDDAKACLEDTNGEAVVAGIVLQLKWGSSSKQQQQQSHNGQRHEQHPSRKKQRLTEAEAMDSSTLYFRLPSRILSAEYNDATESLRQLMERTLEHALAQDGTSEEDQVTAATEPALQVKARIMAATDTTSSMATGGGDNENGGDGNKDAGGGSQQQQQQQQPSTKNYGFLEFASHAAASMAIASLTGSTDGGLLLGKEERHNNNNNNGGSSSGGVDVDHVEALLQDKEHCRGVALHWAKEPPPSTLTKRDQNNNGGLSFQRRHFPKDSRTDCWFCLASPSCERHLISSVHDQVYVAMPKGPVDPGHVLLVPVTHTSKGVLGDANASGIAEEMDELKAQLRKHAHDVYQKNMFVFERAIQTKGGYHTHIQCIPIEKDLSTTKLEATMMGMAKSIPGFDLKEINSDLALSGIIQGSDDDDDDDMDGGYFYAEVPVSATEFKRFLYRDRGTTKKRAVVPLQFGREVIASLMGKPDFAHWKACVVDQEQETELTIAFRESFAKYHSSVGE